MVTLQKVVDKNAENRSFAEIADGPIETLQGVSARQAKHLKAALGVQTVRELANHPLVRVAQAITVLADSEQASDLEIAIGISKPVFTARDLLNSSLIGLWADRRETNDPVRFVQQLRNGELD